MKRSGDRAEPAQMPLVSTYRIAQNKGSVNVTVTSGSLAGKSVKIIPMPPAAAYDGGGKRKSG
jgi:hypothetical protein